jgi:ribosome-associated protein
LAIPFAFRYSWLMLFVTPFIQIPDEEMEFTFMRSSGPGGQAVNKVSSKARLRWNVFESRSVPYEVRERFLYRFGGKLTVQGDLLLTSDQHRDRTMNRDECLEKLRDMLLEVAYPPKERKKTKPTRGSRERTKIHKKRTGEKKKLRGRVRGEGD